MKNFRILTVATLSLMLLSGCSNNLPKESVPMAEGPLSTSASSSSPSNSSSPTATASDTASSAPDTIPTSNNDPAQGDPATATSPPEPPKRDANPPQSTILPGVVDNPNQRNQKLVPDPAREGGPAPSGSGGSGAIIDGVRDSLGAGSREDKQKAAESYIAFVNLVNDKDYSGACEYVKLTPAQGTDCLAAMDKVDIATRTYPVGLKIDRLDNGVINGDTAILNKLVFVYDSDNRIRDVYMSRPADGSEKWKTAL